MTAASNGSAAAASGGARQQAVELRDFLLTDCGRRMHPEASVMGAYLGILLTSCTPDAEELIAGEVESILRILQ